MIVKNDIENILIQIHILEELAILEVDEFQQDMYEKIHNKQTAYVYYKQ